MTTAATGLNLPSRIKPIAKSISQKIEPEHEERDGEPRRDRPAGAETRGPIESDRAQHELRLLGFLVHGYDYGRVDCRRYLLAADTSFDGIG